RSNGHGGDHASRGCGSPGRRPAQRYGHRGRDTPLGPGYANRADSKPMSASVLPAPLAHIPWRVLIPPTSLVCFGAAVLYSAAGGSFHPFASSHLLRFGVFVVMALILRLFPRDLVMWATYPGYAVLLALLLMVEAIGVVGGGAQRWIDLGFMQLQPSEFMKPMIVLVLARFYHSLP